MLTKASVKTTGHFNWRSQIRRHAFLIVILVLTAAARFTILFESQTHVHHDEAIIGLMGKHISEGRYFPFYMYGQPYNAGAALESYVAAISFDIFGVGVIPLKGCIVTMSLVCLGLFYRMALQLYGQRTAVLATLVFALSPSLLKWHFQVRGYSWYFLSIPILLNLFFSIESRSSSKTKKIFLLGLVSGLSLWSLELALTLIAALWVLLAARRSLSTRNAMTGMFGFIIGYAPAIIFNLTHQCSNWRYVFTDKTSSGILSSLFHLSTFAEIFFREMPKFFGSDTVFWYYPETPVLGIVLYVVALLAVVTAILPCLKAPSKIFRTLFRDQVENGQTKDLLLLVFMAACFVPYLAAPLRVPSYFLGGCFFLSILTGRLLEQCFSIPKVWPHLLGSCVLLVIVLIGAGAMMGMRNQIETLLWVRTGNTDSLIRIPARIPGRDIEAVERHLRQNQISSIEVTNPFIYPLLFESDETLAVSDPIFGWDRIVYPKGVAMPVVPPGQRVVFVIESNSPILPSIMKHVAQLTGVAPLIFEYGTLAVIETPTGHSLPK